MANRYWVGGAGTWNTTSTTNWSASTGGAGGASAPGAADAAIFDANSGGGAVVLGENVTCLTLNMSAFTGSLNYATYKITLVGNAATIFTGGTGYSVSGTPLIEATYAGSTGTRTITMGATTEANAVSLNITAGTDLVALGSGSAFKNLNFTGYSGTISNATGKVYYGNLTVSSGMTFTAGTGVQTFSATSGTQQITTNGVTLDFPLTFNGVGGSWQLVDNLTTGSTRTVTLTNGALDLNNNTLSCGLFSSSNSNTRSIAFGTGNITLTGSGATIWSTSTVTGFTLTGTPTVNCTYSGSTGTRTISTSTAFTETNVPNFNVFAGGDTVDFGTSGRRVGSVDFTGFTGTLSNFYVVSYGNLTFSSGMTLTDSANTSQLAGTGTQTITSNGKTIPFTLTIPSGAEAGTRIFADALIIGAGRSLTMRGTVKFTAGTTNTSPNFYFSGSSTNQLYVQSTVSGTQYTLSQASGTVSAVYSTIKDCVATGGATWNAYYDNGNIDGGNNTNWNFGGTPSYDAEYGYKLRSFTEHRRF